MPHSDWTPLITATVGSRAYGLQTAESDTDTLSVAAAPTELFHGLNPPTGRSATRASTNPDIVTHEVGKFISLCLSCNPTVTELLWLPEDCYTDRHPLGFAAQQIRHLLLSADGVRNAYLGYATGQFKRLRDRRTSFSSDTVNRTAKHARHILRLVHQGAELYHTGSLHVRVSNPELYHDFGQMVASDPERGLRRAEETIATHAEAMDSATSPLLREPDRAAANRYLLRVRRHFFSQDR